MSINEQDILEKVMLSISDFFTLEPRQKCRGGIVLKSAYKDILSFLKLKKSKNQVKVFSIDFDSKHQNHNDPFDYMNYEKLPNEMEDSMFHSIQPSAPPIPDSATIGIFKANMLSNLDIDYVPLLEKVCNIHPCLIECQMKRTPKYASWAFISLGRVLHFLEITKVEEMNEEECEWLQKLWEEVQVFGFDLSWLAPQVEFVLNYVEKMSKLNKLEEEKKRIEVRIQELSMELFETEKQMESSKGVVGWCLV
ncbi:uncharacterized protein LOC131599719 [Vicia villosa]|uniref:uncharacterized protein LOC131599719 n=1 Tax=Vicia villosa TaxID=3911 RepID=UPI00273C041E|nr:uncharacterized protein LOC131599719 [Vicia villosa]